MKIRIYAPIDDVSGYAEVARQVAIHLHYEGVEVAVHTQNWGCTLVKLHPEEEQLLCRMKKRKDKMINNLYITVPLFFKKREGINIGMTMSEVSGIPGNWVEYCKRIDRVIVPSKFNLKTFGQSGIDQKQLGVVPLGINHSLFTPEGNKSDFINSANNFTFLSVGERIPRKGFEFLIKAFVQEFSAQDAVCLVLKSHRNGSDYDHTGKKIKNEIQRLVRKENKTKPPKIYLVPQTIPSQEMPDLYRMAHCYVSATRGEGWSLPVFEALLCGTPVITTNWSAYLDYLNNENAYLVDVEELETIFPKPD